MALPGRGGAVIEDARFTENRNGRAELRRRYRHRSASARRCPGGAIAPQTPEPVAAAVAFISTADDTGVGDK